jgi:hypothetical protein
VALVPQRHSLTHRNSNNNNAVTDTGQGIFVYLGGSTAQAIIPTGVRLLSNASSNHHAAPQRATNGGKVCDVTFFCFQSLKLVIIGITHLPAGE